MEGLYPLSIVVHGVALNITVQSYRGLLCFGLIACRRAVPDIAELALQLNQAMEALRRLPVPEGAEAAEAAALAEVATPVPLPDAVAKRARRPASRAKPRLVAVEAAPEAVEPLARMTDPTTARTRRRRAVAASA